MAQIITPQHIYIYIEREIDLRKKERKKERKKFKNKRIYDTKDRDKRATRERERERGRPKESDWDIERDGSIRVRAMRPAVPPHLPPRQSLDLSGQPWLCSCPHQTSDNPLCCSWGGWHHCRSSFLSFRLCERYHNHTTPSWLLSMAGFFAGDRSYIYHVRGNPSCPPCGGSPLL